MIRKKQIGGGKNFRKRIVAMLLSGIIAFSAYNVAMPLQLSAARYEISNIHPSQASADVMPDKLYVGDIVHFEDGSWYYYTGIYFKYLNNDGTLLIEPDDILLSESSNITYDLEIENQGIQNLEYWEVTEKRYKESDDALTHALVPEFFFTLKAVLKSSSTQQTGGDPSTSNTPSVTNDQSENNQSADEQSTKETEPPKDIPSEMLIFAEENVAKINATPKGGVVEIDARPWNTLGGLEREALKARPDVTLKVSFLSEGHKGIPLKVTIPADSNIDSLYDSNGFMGLCRVGSTIGYDQ